MEVILMISRSPSDVRREVASWLVQQTKDRWFLDLTWTLLPYLFISSIV
jgi:hypothetical protein